MGSEKQEGTCLLCGRWEGKNPSKSQFNAHHNLPEQSSSLTVSTCLVPKYSPTIKCVGFPSLPFCAVLCQLFLIWAQGTKESYKSSWCLFMVQILVLDLCPFQVEKWIIRHRTRSGGNYQQHPYPRMIKFPRISCRIVLVAKQLVVSWFFWTFLDKYNRIKGLQSFTPEFGLHFYCLSWLSS